MTICDFNKLNNGDEIICVDNFYDDFTIDKTYVAYNKYDNCIVTINDDNICLCADIKKFETIKNYIIQKRKDKINKILL